MPSATSEKQVPPDFPRGGSASVSGFQPKLVLRQVDGKYIEGWTDEELYTRFDACADLVTQLTAYCRRKMVELPDMTFESLLPRVRQGVANKGWDVTDAELDWIMSQVTLVMSKPGKDRG